MTFFHVDVSTGTVTRLSELELIAERRALDECDAYLALLLRISIDPRYLAGQPRIDGTRISVVMVLSLLRGSQTCEEIVHDFPNLTTLDIQAALAYAESQLPGVPPEHYDA